MKISLLAFPDMTPLDLLGPLQVFARWADAEVETVWKTTDPIPSDAGATMVPSATFETGFEAPDVVVVPGGAAVDWLMEDAEVMGYLREKSRTARYMTSVYRRARARRRWPPQRLPRDHALGIHAALAGLRCRTGSGSLGDRPRSRERRRRDRRHRLRSGPRRGDRGRRRSADHPAHARIRTGAALRRGQPGHGRCCHRAARPRPLRRTRAAARDHAGENA